MIEGRTVGLAISGDPTRQPMGRYLFECYKRYQYLDQLALSYKRNPALAFNEAARSFDTDLFVGVAGDLYVGESELFRFVRLPYDVPFSWMPLYPRRHSAIPYPKPWAVQTDRPFVSGLFCVKREHLLYHPMPVSPSFSEDVLWERAVQRLGLTFAAVQVPCVHVDHHPTLPRLRKLVWAVLTPERFRQRSRVGALGVAIKATGWEWKDGLDGLAAAGQAKGARFDRRRAGGDGRV